MVKDQIGYGLKILFIGINPHPGSYQRGVPFSNNKMFWYLLSDAGLLEEPRDVLKDDKKLKHLYLHEFKKRYRFGLINIVNRPSRTAAEIKKKEAISGKKRIFAAIKKYSPRVVCFVGKITYSLFIESSNFSYGWQDDIAMSKIYVSHAPHRGWASVRIKEFKDIIALLKSIGK